MDRAGIKDYERLCRLAPGLPETLPGAPSPQSRRWTFGLIPFCVPSSSPSARDVDALGPTNWFQGMWPTDPSMPEPKFPHFEIDPVCVGDPGVRIRKATYNDPSFNPRCDHWGDACAWPLDAFIAFDGLLRYGEQDRAARFAEHYNRNVFATLAETRQPAEFYHSDGHPCGCPVMGSAGLVMLNFQRFLRVRESI